MIMRAIARTLQSAEYLPLCHTYLPSFSVAVISYSLIYARQFLRIPNISFNINQKALMGPGGAQFLADVKEAQRQIFVWTVNEESFMRCSVRNEVDGVVTDDPAKFQRVCGEREADRLRYGGYAGGSAGDDDDGITVLQRINVLMSAVVMFLLGGVFAIIHPADLKEFTSESYEGCDEWREP
ncbi:hypothetical protein FQN50_005551 [Emmonsiellopsis sp. PD_5]|nr:hypothetical protein FQN50_005551 [Emmonsiellopsis sp. PD_5]